MSGFEDEFREQQVRALRRNSAKVMAEAVARSREITGTATSPDGSVRAVVDSTGMLTSLELGPARRDHAALAAQVTAAVQRAAARARAEVRNHFALLVDAGVIDELPDWLPEPPHVAAAPAAPPRPADEEPVHQPKLSEDAW
ncbi:YbaB/EbfC family nucleoid-associated protein [Saccharothrix hoggarensis]